MTLKSLISQSWQLTKGVKGKFWLITFYLIITELGVLTVTGFINTENRVWIVLHSLISSFATAPFAAGIMMIGVARARNEHINYKSWLGYAKNFWKVGVVLFVTDLITNLPNLYFGIQTYKMFSVSVVILQIVFNLVFNFLFLLAVIVAIDKKVNPFQACLLSAQMMLKNFKIAIKLYLFIGILFIGIICTVFIASIWIYPLILMLISVFYVRVVK